MSERWVLELRRAGSLEWGTAPGPGVYRYPPCRTKVLYQYSLRRFVRRLGWFAFYSINLDDRKPPEGEAWRLSGFIHDRNWRLEVHASRGGVRYTIIAPFAPPWPDRTDIPPTIEPRDAEEDYLLVRMMRLDTAPFPRRGVLVTDLGGEPVPHRRRVWEGVEAYYAVEVLVKEEALDAISSLRVLPLYEGWQEVRDTWRHCLFTQVRRKGTTVGWYLASKHHPLEVLVGPTPPRVKEVTLEIEDRGTVTIEGRRYEDYLLVTTIRLERPAPSDASYAYVIKDTDTGVAIYEGEIEVRKGEETGRDEHEILVPEESRPLRLVSCCQGVCSGEVTAEPPRPPRPPARVPAPALALAPILLGSAYIIYRTFGGR